MLQHLLDATPRGIYWGYLSTRARALNLPQYTPETWLKSLSSSFCQQFFLCLIMVRPLVIVV